MLTLARLLIEYLTTVFAISFLAMESEAIERFHIHSNENEHKNNHGYIVKSAILLNQFQCASALKLWWEVQKRRKTLVSSNFSIVNMENAYYTKKI